ncbi:hypothetical protein [Bacillus sp. EB01]|uniref:hypothetical protein n=1 Tax=Bacillus sp. EB01 TaxID=1347086 RepID=UPI0005C46A35|nr:hypothetical protein [Bacillus sp. EB01]
MINVILLIVIIAIVFSTIPKSGRRIVNFKATHGILLGYIGILLIAAFIVPFFKIDPFEAKEGSTSLDFFYEDLMDGELDKIPGVKLTDKKSFNNYTNETVTVKSPQEGATIFIEKTFSEANTIEAYSYGGTVAVNGIDFSHLLRPVKLELENDTITISDPTQDIDISLVTKDFLGTQFSGEQISEKDPFRNYMSSEFVINDFSFYLKIPRNIEIIAPDSDRIVYVEK